VDWIRAKLSAMSTGQILAYGVGLVVLLVVIWYFGGKAINHLQGWFYDRGTNQAHQQIDALQKEADASKAVAQDALNKLAEEKKVTAEERRKRELAEQILADKSKTSNQKLKAYEDAVNRAPTVTAPQSTDELCARAASLGLSCD
jgi:predicted acyl esterase